MSQRTTIFPYLDHRPDNQSSLNFYLHALRPPRISAYSFVTIIYLDLGLKRISLKWQQMYFTPDTLRNFFFSENFQHSHCVSSYRELFMHLPLKEFPDECFGGQTNSMLNICISRTSLACSLAT